MLLKKYSFTYFAVVSLFAIAFFSRCAQPAAPQGGPRDSTAPVLLNVFPPNFSTNFKAREIVFTFNEYLQFKDLQKEVLISPPMMPRPIFSLKGKGFVVKFPPELKLDSNTTYKIDFGNAVQDNNEGNPAKRFEYTFSTGAKVDSLAMSGKLVDAATGADIINGFVLYVADEVITADTLAGDSTIFKGKKLSIARTDSTGNFLATNLKPLAYRIFAIKDENGNQEYDMGTDMVGLLNARFNPAQMKDFEIWIDPVKDRVEVSPQVKFELFKETRRLTQKFKEAKRPKENLLEFVFAADSVVIESIVIDSLLQEDIIIENNIFNDSLRVWLRTVKEDSKLSDTLKGVVKYHTLDSAGLQKIDSATFALSFFKQDDKTGGDKVAEKFNSLFEKIGEWLKKLFMGKKKKMAIAAAQHRRYVADSLKQMQTDSVALVQRVDSLAKADSLAQRIAAGLEIRRDSNKVFKPTFSSTGDMIPTNVLYLLGNYPFDKIDTSKISIVRLSFKERGEDDFDVNDADMKETKPDVMTKQNYVLTSAKEDITKWEIGVDWQPKSEYHITIDKDALLDISGAVNDSLTQIIKTADPLKYGRVLLDIKMSDSTSADKNYIISLMDSTNNIVATKNSKGSGRIMFDYLQPKSYKIKFVEDRNGNGVQDMGSVLKNIEAEHVELFYPRKGNALFPTKENWDVEFEIYPEKIFNPDLIVPEKILIEETDSLPQPIKQNEKK